MAPLAPAIRILIALRFQFALRRLEDFRRLEPLGSRRRGPSAPLGRLGDLAGIGPEHQIDALVGNAITVALVFALMMIGMIDASMTRRPSTPLTRRSGVTTVIG